MSWCPPLSRNARENIGNQIYNEISAIQNGDTMRQCEKHSVNLVGNVECDDCIREQRDVFKRALERIANEPHSRIYLVDIAREALNP